MKKCALALVLAISTVTWGYPITGISIIAANPITTHPIGIAMSFHGFVNGFACGQMTQTFQMSSGCQWSGSHLTCIDFQWPCHHTPCHNQNDTTSANSSTSTTAGGPVGNAVADAASSSTSGNSSSTSSSHSQSTVN
jgi:hypothetical protein